jgi:hypothetical protein
MVYCTYNLLNMFRALICPSSGARDYTCVITACGVCNVFVAGGRRSCAGQQAMRPGWVKLLERIACCPAPDRQPPVTKTLHTICGNNKSIVSRSWWWAYKCPKHVEQIISAINHSVASSWFFFSTHVQRCTDKHTSNFCVCLFNGAVATTQII